MKTTFAAIAALALISGSAMAASPGCTVNWVNGDCGKATSDASHQKPRFIDRTPEKPDCEEEETSKPV